jgi:pilus assembly protein CpaE
VQPDAKDTIPPSLINKILSTLKQNFDFVVVDTSPAFDEHVLQAFDETDELLLVTTLDVPTLKNVKIASETLDLLNFPKSRRHLVLNRADDKVGLSADKVEVTLDMKIAQKIPTSPEVANATNSGEPITASLPKHPVSQSFLRLAQAVTRPTSAKTTAAAGAGAGDARAQHMPGGAPRRGLLRRGGKQQI